MNNKPQKEDNTRLVLAVIFIAVGGLWILRKLGFYVELQPIFYQGIFNSINQIFHWITNIIFSWPMILILVGAVLLAGKRSAGIVLLVVGALFLLPRLFFFNGFTATLLLPLILVGVGVAMVARMI